MRSRNDGKWVTYVRVLIESHFLKAGADVGHPRRVDHGQRFNADLGRWKRKLDRVRRNLEGVRGP